VNEFTGTSRVYRGGRKGKSIGKKTVDPWATRLKEREEPRLSRKIGVLRVELGD